MVVAVLASATAGLLTGQLPDVAYAAIVTAAAIPADLVSDQLAKWEQRHREEHHP